MTTTDLETSAPTARLKYLSAASLFQRAALGIAILSVGTILSVWLYDASIKANASDLTSAAASPSPISQTKQ